MSATKWLQNLWPLSMSNSHPNNASGTNDRHLKTQSPSSGINTPTHSIGRHLWCWIEYGKTMEKEFLNYTCPYCRWHKWHCNRCDYKTFIIFQYDKKVDCAFMPSPTSITVTRYGTSKYMIFGSDSITIMDVNDSVVNLHGVIIKSTQ